MTRPQRLTIVFMLSAMMVGALGCGKDEATEPGPAGAPSVVFVSWDQVEERTDGWDVHRGYVKNVGTATAYNVTKINSDGIVSPSTLAPQARGVFAVVTISGWSPHVPEFSWTAEP